jgi:hypothetical protein
MLTKLLEISSSWDRSYEINPFQPRTILMKNH